MRRGLLLVALALGAIAVLIVVSWYAEDGDWVGAGGVLILGAVVVAPLALPLRYLRSPSYRPIALGVAVLTGLVYLFLTIAGGLLLFPSALLVLLSTLTRQPP